MVFRPENGVPGGGTRTVEPNRTALKWTMYGCKVRSAYVCVGFHGESEWGKSSIGGAKWEVHRAVAPSIV